ncbi:MAG: phosphatase PAP2 family protein [Thermoanaerobaculia bacterium]
MSAALMLTLLTGAFGLEAQVNGSTQAAALPAIPTQRTNTVLDLPDLVVKDGRQLASLPMRWHGRDWILLAGAVAIVGVVAAFDRRLLDAAQAKNASADWVTSRLEPFGGTESFGVPVVFYLTGALTHSSHERQVGLDCILASGFASGLVTPLIQRVGRSRPSAGQGTYSFDGGTAGHFPSGHSTQAFALASVIAASYSSPWVKSGAYTVASVVAFARVRHNAHFPSDVLAGALIGTAIGCTIVRLNRSSREASTAPGESRRAQIMLFPGFDERGPSLGVRASF